MSFSKPKAPQPTQAQLDLENAQKAQLTQLDTEENRRRKRLLNAAQGVRAFPGSTLFRNQPNPANQAQGTGAAGLFGGAAAVPPGGGYGRISSPGTGGGGDSPRTFIP